MFPEVEDLIFRTPTRGEEGEYACIGKLKSGQEQTAIFTLKIFRTHFLPLV